MYQAKDAGRDGVRLIGDTPNACYRDLPSNTIFAPASKPGSGVARSAEADTESGKLVGAESTRAMRNESGEHIRRRAYSDGGETGEIVPLGDWVSRTARR